MVPRRIRFVPLRDDLRDDDLRDDATRWITMAGPGFHLTVPRILFPTVQGAERMSTESTSSPVVDALRKVVADSYALMGQTHICHWNVRGPAFFSLHTAFEEQYTELFGAIDLIAERIRALGAFAPGGLGNLSRMAGIEEIAEEADAKRMVSHLVAANTHLLKDLEKARDLAAEHKDAETEDMMIGRIQVHEKTNWMLRSFLA